MERDGMEKEKNFLLINQYLKVNMQKVLKFKIFLLTTKLNLYKRIFINLFK